MLFFICWSHFLFSSFSLRSFYSHTSLCLQSSFLNILKFTILHSHSYIQLFYVFLYHKFARCSYVCKRKKHKKEKKINFQSYSFSSFFFILYVFCFIFYLDNKKKIKFEQEKKKTYNRFPKGSFGMRI